jgi:SAM-dependent methyltransferase
VRSGTWTSVMLRRLASVLRLRSSLPARYRDLIARHAPGGSFADVGCMWNVDGTYAFHALDQGATRVVGVDLMPATERFLARNHARDDRVRFVHGDINDPTVVDGLGAFDTVFCSGVLYHVPNPVLTLEQLRRICRRVLILVSATIPELGVSQGAIFLPFLDARQRRRLNFRTPDVKMALDSAFVAEQGYANWFWGLTPTCIEAMVRSVGFEVSERYRYRHALCLVCRPRTKE